MKNVFLFFTIVMASFLVTSCIKDDPADPDDTIDSFDSGVFISCEGAFGQGNAQVYFLDLQRSEYVPGIFNFANQKPIGDVLHSMTFEDDMVYLVVNNSGKIMEVSQTDFIETGAIEGLTAPTELEIVSDKGYIGDLYASKILVVDMNSLSVTDSIMLGESSNQVMESENNLWVLSQSEYQGRVKNHIYFVNLADYTVDSVAVGANPLQWAHNDADQLFVYCQGSEQADAPSVYVINTVTRLVEQVVEIEAPESYFSNLAYDDRNDRLLVQLPDGIYTYQPGQTNLSNDPLIDLQGVQFVYGMDVSPVNGDIYIGDARDFSSAGAVYIYAQDGQPVSTFPVGIGPNHFYFE